MPTYPVINLETKEKKTLSMTMKQYAEWKEENPGWDKDWSEGCAGQSREFRVDRRSEVEWLERSSGPCI